MAMSGVSCDDTIVNNFKEQKLRKSFRYILCNIKDRSKIVQLETGDPLPNDCDRTPEGDVELWNDFIQSKLNSKDCYYAIYDFAYHDSNGPKNKLIFITWCPDTGAVKDKMLYSSSKDNLRKKLDGIGVAVQANDLSDLDYKDIKEKVQSKV